MSCYGSMGEPMPCDGWARKSLRSLSPSNFATSSLGFSTSPTYCHDVLVVVHDGSREMRRLELELTDQLYLPQFTIPTQRTQSTS